MQAVSMEIKFLLQERYHIWIIYSWTRSLKIELVHFISSFFTEIQHNEYVKQEMIHLEVDQYDW